MVDFSSLELKVIANYAEDISVLQFADDHGNQARINSSGQIIVSGPDWQGEEGNDFLKYVQDKFPKDKIDRIFAERWKVCQGVSKRGEFQEDYNAGYYWRFEGAKVFATSSGSEFFFHMDDEYFICGKRLEDGSPDSVDILFEDDASHPYLVSARELYGEVREMKPEASQEKPLPEVQQTPKTSSESDPFARFDMAELDPVFRSDLPTPKEFEHFPWAEGLFSQSFQMVNPFYFRVGEIFLEWEYMTLDIQNRERNEAVTYNLSSRSELERDLEKVFPEEKRNELQKKRNELFVEVVNHGEITIDEYGAITAFIDLGSSGRFSVRFREYGSVFLSSSRGWSHDYYNGPEADKLIAALRARGYDYNYED